MKTVAFVFLVLCSVAIVSLVFTSGMTINIVVLTDVEEETAEAVLEQLPIDSPEGVYCNLQGCCADHEGLDSISLKNDDGVVMCKDGEPSPSCTCPRQDLSR